MGQRIAIASIVAASSLISLPAHAANFCASTLLHTDGTPADYQPDEMTSTLSMTRAYELRACVCDDACETACNVFVPDMGADACGLADPYGASSACNSCIVSSCTAEFLACYFDGPA